MTNFQQYIDYASHVGAPEGIADWLERRLVKMDDPGTEAVEHVIDFIASDDAPDRFNRMSWKDAAHSAHKWVERLKKRGNGITETETDTETVLDFGDGFKVVKLIGKAAYEREGALMRHCVGSYHGRDMEVYSLRDNKNMPHCTIEKDVQIKGKGNGDIHPKYVDYVVRFLEHTGMQVRDSEMEHLGYEVVPFGSYVKTAIYRDRYVPKGASVEYRDDCVIVYDQGSACVKTDKVLLLSGSVNVRKGATFDAPALTEVSGSVNVRKGATFDAPALTKSGYVDVREGATFDAPLLVNSQTPTQGTNQ